MTALSDWLHKLPAPRVQALREFRRAAREAYPDDPNPIARALDDKAASAWILAQPRDYIVALDH